MAETIRVDLNLAGVGQILKSDKVRLHLLERAERIAAVAGEGFEADSMIGRNRARAGVITRTSAARKAEAEDRALTRALDAGRG